MSNTQNQTFLEAVRTWWRNRRQQHAAIAELDRLGEPELSLVAQEVGLNAPQLRTLAGRWPEYSGLLSQRLAALGVDNEAIASGEPAVLRDLQRVCGQCPAERRCSHDLEGDEGDRAWRDYWPNVATLDALRSEARDRRLMRRRKWRHIEPTLPPCC